MPEPRGRPRTVESPTGLGTAEDVLHAAGQLFSARGFAATSTHAIAQVAGIRQASLYHYFASKNEILLRLLTGTVSPSVETARTLLVTEAPASARLWALCAWDARLLVEDRFNVGSLYLQPEVDDDYFAEFHALRRELREAYARLVIDAAGPGAAVLTDLVLGLVESVILLRRRDPGGVDAQTPGLVADGALRLVFVTEQETGAAHRRGAELLISLPHADRSDVRIL
jgi:AcrR family transcriptional regulator